MSDTVYIPEEDSFLLAGCIKRYAKGNTLDMGCASGIQGITALGNKNVTEVTFSDINEKALKYTKNALTEDNNSKSKKTNFIHSDLFDNIKDKYDTIIFNPPYLPEDELDKEVLITTGGKHGYELTETFLKQAKTHLNIDGQILLLFSSLSKKGEIDQIIRQLDYNKFEIGKEHLFMEQLYVYQIKIKSDNILKGQRGIVEIKGNIAIKRARNSHYDAEGEATFLKLLNKHHIGPKYISHTKDSLSMEYIDGQRILDYLADKNTTKKDIISIIEKILVQVYDMDKLKISKLELTHPYKHIIIRNKIPIQIDFERCTYTDKPKNVTQFIQFLCSGKVAHIIKNKHIKVNVKTLRELALKYKKDIKKEYLKEIIDSIQ
jgi:HemK-related putative methylase